MPDAALTAICNTSPLQYLHQLRLPDLLPSLYSRILVPTAVVGEIDARRALGHDLPDGSMGGGPMTRPDPQIKALRFLEA